MPPDLHRAVRESYRRAMQQRHTEHDAFDAAMRLVIEQEPQVDRIEARRLVARMLAQEPMRRG
jgi:hypothetical protein